MMNFTFYRPEDVNIAEFGNIIGKLHYDLELLNSTEVDELEVYSYVWGLVKAAKPLERNPEMMFWGMAEPQTMPSDCRVEFFYKPSYIATAILMQAILKHPEIYGRGASQWEYGEELAEGVAKVLPGALLGCTGRRFAGSGYDDIKGLFETLRIFAEGNVVRFVEEYPDVCPEFTKTYNEAVTFIELQVAEGEWKDGWGTDYIEDAKAVLALLEK